MKITTKTPVSDMMAAWRQSGGVRIVAAGGTTDEIPASDGSSRPPLIRFAGDQPLAAAGLTLPAPVGCTWGEPIAAGAVSIYGAPCMRDEALSASATIHPGTCVARPLGGAGWHDRA